MRFVIAASTTALVLSAAGCSVGGSAKTDDQPPDNALSKIDSCSILKPEKASQLGLPTHGDPDNSIVEQPGCTYLGDRSGIAIHRLTEVNIEEFGNRSVWSSFKQLKVNSRDGAEARQKGATDKQCATVVSASGGLVMVYASPADPRKPFDACAESLKVAKLIEPDLPK